MFNVLEHKNLITVPIIKERGVLRVKKYFVAILNIIVGGLFLTIGYSTLVQALVESLTTKMNNPELLIVFGYICSWLLA